MKLPSSKGVLWLAIVCKLYLNQVCLQTVLPWLQEKSAIERVVNTGYPEV